jgi:signal transduction histidine kinase
MLQKASGRPAMAMYRTDPDQATLRLALEAAGVEPYDWDTRAGLDEFLEGVHPEDRGRVAAALRAAISGVDPLRIEYRIQGDGTGVRWLSDRARALPDQNGRSTRLVGVRADVTRRHAAEEALRLGEQRLQLALEAGRLGSWVFDIPSATLAASPQCKANHGRPPEADLSLERDVIGDIDESHRRGFRDALAHSAETGAVFEVEVPNTWPDGTRHWLLIRGRKADAKTMVGVTLDVTARRAAEQALLDADREKDQFLTVLAHELRGPIAPIVTAARILQETGPQEPRLVKNRETILRQARRLASLVDDLLDVGRIREGKLRIERRRVELNSVLKDAAEACAPAIERRRHALHVHPADRPLYVDADEGRLVQVVCNLLSNAAKYMKEGGRIDLAASEEPGAAVVAVSDEGVGIPREMLATVFQRYVQVGSSGHRADGGLGIGLSLVKALVEEHGGTVRALSDGIGHGSRFEVRLPKAASAPAP